MTIGNRAPKSRFGGGSSSLGGSWVAAGGTGKACARNSCPGVADLRDPQNSEQAGHR